MIAVTIYSKCCDDGADILTSTGRRGSCNQVVIDCCRRSAVHPTCTPDPDLSGAHNTANRIHINVDLRVPRQHQAVIISLAPHAHSVWTTCSDCWTMAAGLQIKRYTLQPPCHSLLKVKEGHTPKEHRRGAHLPFIGRWARRWINHCWLWCMASATSDLRLPSQPKLVLIAPTHRGMARLSWPGWLVTYRDSLPAWRRSPIQALTGPCHATRLINYYW